MLLPFTRRLSTTSILACCFPPSAGELVNCSLSSHSSNGWRVSQMRPAVEGQGGRDLQVWAFSAIPKGDLSSPHSAQLGKHLCSCLGTGSQCKPSPSTFQAHPSHAWASLRAPSTDCELTLPRVSLLLHTHAHTCGHTHARTHKHTHAPSTSLLCIGTCHHPRHMQNEAQTGCVRQEQLTR